MVLCVGPTPALQRVMIFRRVVADGVNRAATTLDGPAGKAVNVAKVLHALGQPARVVGFVGGERGAWVVASLRNLGVESDFVSVSSPTRECVTVIDQEAGTQTELVEESRAVTAEDYSALLDRIRGCAPACRAVVMSGTLTPGAPEDFYLQVARLAQVSGAITIIDAHGPPLAEALPGQPDLVKPNRAELAAMLGRELRDEDGVRAGLRELRDRGARRVVVTSGERTVLAHDGQRIWRITPPRIPALNPVGSGDAFTAGLVARWLEGADLGEACRWGVAAGAANALTLMAGEVNRADVERLAPGARVELLPRD